MINDISKIREQAAAMFINFSDILKKDVRDVDGKVLGRVWDISANLGEVYPKLGELLMAVGSFKKLYASVPWSSVMAIEDDIIINLKAESIRFERSVKEYDLLLRRDILDQQVVDTFNHKVKRVNDVHLLKVDHELVIAHVDIGLRGLFRRLGWERAIDFFVKIIAKDSK